MKKRKRRNATRSTGRGGPRRGAGQRGSKISGTELRLRQRLRELTETVDALRSGAVDAVVVSGPRGNQIYSLSGAEQPYRIYVERMQEGAVTLSAEGVILYTNRRFAEMVDVPLERAIGADVRPFIGGILWQEIARVLQGEKATVKCTGTLLRRGHGGLPVHLSASGLEIDEQEMICLVVTDLTMQQEAAQLRMAKDLAEKANVAKDDFLAALSHELRTPLTPALMAAVAAEEDPALPPHLRDEIAVIRRNVELEARLIDDLLDLTRVARDKLELRWARVDLHGCIDEAIAICRPDIAAKDLQLQVHKGAEHAHVTGDPVRLEQVLWNVLRNAVKFTPRGGHITVRTCHPDPEKLRIEVTDTGIGFDGETKDRLFQAFEQGGREITRIFGGLGLGLAISRSITEAHGGQIDATSLGPGRGATFTIDLPMRSTEPAEPAAEAPSPGIADPSGGLRILLVEDHKDTRNVLARALRRHHHVVHVAASADNALEIAAQHPFDVVISDLGLPDRSGLELMRELRDRFALRGIAVSGYGTEDDVNKSRSAGFVHHLTKPICVNTLRTLLRTLDIGPVG